MYIDALAESVKSIADDPNIDEEKKLEMLLESMEQFREAVSTPAPEPEEEPEPDYEDIEDEPENRYDTIVEFHKFNPFHDARGRFASSNGFASYSADPNKKAGAMAISRSVAAGHGKTVNVHPSSGGSTLTQNAGSIGGRGSAGILRNRVEPMTGLKGASQFGAMSHAANQKAGKVIQPKAKTPAKVKTQQTTQPKQTKPTTQQTTQPKQTKPTTQQTTQPKQTKPTTQQTTQPKRTKLRDDIQEGFTKKTGLKSSDKNMKNATLTPDRMKKIGVSANYEDAPLNKDISKKLPAKLDFDRSKGEFPLDAIAKLQGNKKPAITDDADEFTKACMTSGIILRRSVHGNRQKGLSSEDICVDTMTSYSNKNQFGGTCYGTGRYFTTGVMDPKDTHKSHKQSLSAEKESFAYGDRQMLATLKPEAKVCDPSTYRKLYKDFQKLPDSKKDKFKVDGLDDEESYDVNAYIASKGYDFIAKNRVGDGSYGTVLNDGALLYYNEVGVK